MQTKLVAEVKIDLNEVQKYLNEKIKELQSASDYVGLMRMSLETTSFGGATGVGAGLPDPYEVIRRGPKLMEKHLPPVISSILEEKIERLTR